MKIYAYNIYMTHNGEAIDKDLKDFFYKINDIPRVNRLRKICNGEPILMDNKKIMPTLRTGFSFYKYREDYKPYIESVDGSLKQITEDVVELTNGILDHNSNLLLLQFNFNGLREKTIETYLNNFLEGESFKINIERIYESFELNEIFDSNKIDLIEPIFKKGLFNEGTTAFGTKLSAVSAFLTENSEENPNIGITIKNTKKKGTFSGESLRTLISTLESKEFEGELKDIKVSYTNKKGKKEKKSINSLRRRVEIDILNRDKNPAWELTLDKIEESHGTIYGDAMRHSTKLITQLKEIGNTYTLKATPDDLYKL